MAARGGGRIPTRSPWQGGNLNLTRFTRPRVDANGVARSSTDVEPWAHRPQNISSAESAIHFTARGMRQGNWLKSYDAGPWPWGDRAALQDIHV